MGYMKRPIQKSYTDGVNALDFIEALTNYYKALEEYCDYLESPKCDSCGANVVTYYCSDCIDLLSRNNSF